MNNLFRRFAVLGLVAGVMGGAQSWAEEGLPEDKVYEMEMLTGKDFSKADLGDSKFYRVRLNEANFGGANLAKATFQQCDLYKSDFRGAIFSDETKFKQVTMNDSDFSGVDFQKADLDSVNFRGSNLQGTKNFGDIHRVNFSGSDVRGADFSTATNVSDETYWKGVIYDDATKFPAGVDVIKAKAIKK